MYNTCNIVNSYFLQIIICIFFTRASSGYFVSCISVIYVSGYFYMHANFIGVRLICCDFAECFQCNSTSWLYSVVD